MDDLLIPPEEWKVTAQAENALAGCILVDADNTLRLIRGIVRASDFQSDECRTVFLAAAGLIDNNKPCDPVLIQAEAQRLGTPLDDEYCEQIMRMPVPIGNSAATAQIIHEAAATRAARVIGSSLMTNEITPVDALRQLQELLTEKESGTQTPEEAANTVLDYIRDAYAGKTKTFISTGYSDLDKQLGGGIVTSGLFTLAARPGTGKTTAALCIADNVAAAGGTVLYVSLEMDTKQLWVRRAANISGLGYADIYAGRVGKTSKYDDEKTKRAKEDEWKRLTDAFEKLSKRQLTIRDKPSTIDDIEREARCTKNLSLLVIDHIGLIRQLPGQKSFSRYEFVTSVAHRLKQLALSLHVPILALCQLNRGSEQRTDKTPNMADLRDSGAIEEDSDVVCLLYRDALYRTDDKAPKQWERQTIDFIIDKNRHGMTGTVTLNFFGVTARITEEEKFR